MIHKTQSDSMGLLHGPYSSAYSKGIMFHGKEIGYWVAYAYTYTDKTFSAFAIKRISVKAFYIQ